MRFLISLRHPGYIRYLKSTLVGLAERDHEIALFVGISPDDTKSHTDLLSRMSGEMRQLEAKFPGSFSVRPGVEPRGSRERDLGGSLRAWQDFLHFLEPAFDEAPKLRARGGALVPEPLREPSIRAAESPELRSALMALLRTVEQMLPVPARVRGAVAEEQPDAVVVCPLIERRSPQATYLRAAHELGIPTALCVASWDNLTTSSLIHGEPEIVTVWNEAQRGEAVELHGTPPERVVVTGAPLYDDWFVQTPTTSREAFCEMVGLSDARPYLLYVCSSGFIAPDEAAWIRRWLGNLRRSGIRELADIQVLIRPHPQHRLLDGSPAAQRLQRTPGVAIYPPDGELPVSADTRAEYYDSIHHSAAVAGINTSAMIESAIGQRGVHVLLTERYRNTQEGLPHFAHLRSAGGGLLQVTADWSEHAEGLACAIRGEDAADVAERSRSFLTAFIRPHGLEQAATPHMIDSLERLAESDVQPPTRVPGPPEEQLEAAIATLEPLLGVPGEHRRRARRAERARVRQ